MQGVVLGAVAPTMVYTDWMLAVREANFDDLLLTQGGPFVSRSRNTIVEAFLETKEQSHLLFVDTDIIFTCEDVETLLAVDELVVGGVYSAKDQGVSVGLLDDEDNFQTLSKPPEKLQAVGYVGAGFLLLHRDALEKIGSHWFDHRYGPSGLEGEDLSFCRRVHDAGVDVWCEPKATVGHLKLYELRPGP